jgi:hypothetical protein
MFWGFLKKRRSEISVNKEKQEMGRKEVKPNKPPKRRIKKEDPPVWLKNRLLKHRRKGGKQSTKKDK